MPKRFVSTNYGEIISTRILEFRQDAPPRAVPTKIGTTALAVSGGNYAAISPDQTGAVIAANSATAPNFYFIPDPAYMEGRITPSATFGGTIAAVAISNSYYAIGGASPFLYVFRRSDHGLETVSTTGLGTVTALDFSPDGTKLLVGHSNTSGLRVYTVGTWTYVDAVTAFGTPTAAAFSGDGTRVAAQQVNSPYIAVYSADLATRHYTSTSSSYAGSYTISGSGPRAARSPLSSSAVLISNNAALLQVDTATGTVSTFASIPSSTMTAVVVDPEPEEDAVYVQHNYDLVGRTWTKFKISTRTVAPVQPDEFRSFMYGTGNGVVCAGYIVRTTPHLITGTVRDVSNNPAGRIVRAFDRSTGELAAQTTSNPGTGDYTLKVYSPGPYDLQFMAVSGDQSVSLLLRGEGADGSTTVSDNSLYGWPVIQRAPALVTNSTTGPKVGSGSLRFPGNAALWVTQNAAFEIASRNFTIEMWAKLDGAITTGNRHLISLGWNVNNRLSLYITGGTRKIELYSNNNGTGSTYISGGTVANDTWTHIALVRNGSTITLYQDGVSIGSTTTAQLPPGTLGLDIGGQRHIATLQATDYFVGNIDEFRFSAGVARYTSGFTPPTAALPDPRSTAESLNDLIYARAEPVATT